MKMRWRGLADDNPLAAVLLSLLLLTACGYCLYQFSQLEKNARRLEALRGQERVFRQLQARLPPEGAPREQLQTQLRQSAQAHGIVIAEMTESEEGVRVSLPAAPFERLLPWLAALQREHGIRVLALAVERGALPEGEVQVSQLRLAAPPVI